MFFHVFLWKCLKDVKNTPKIKENNEKVCIIITFSLSLH